MLRSAKTGAVENLTDPSEFGERWAIHRQPLRLLRQRQQHSLLYVEIAKAKRYVLDINQAESLPGN